MAAKAVEDEADLCNRIHGDSSTGGWPTRLYAGWERGRRPMQSFVGADGPPMGNYLLVCSLRPLATYSSSAGR